MGRRSKKLEPEDLQISLSSGSISRKYHKRFNCCFFSALSKLLGES